jgi:primosomal replication protein N
MKKHGNTEVYMNYEDSNTVTLKGTVVTEPVYTHSVYEEGFYEFFVEVPRLSDQKDRIPVTMSERLMAGHVIEVGSFLSVVGQFRSYNKMVDGRSKLMLTVFVTDFLDDTDANPNAIKLCGYVCKPPIYRMTPFKREICDVLLAVNRAYNKSDYIPCIAWGRNARFVQTLPVGTKLTLYGRIQSREYQKRLPDGSVEVRVAYEVSVGRVTEEEPDYGAYHTREYSEYAD